jgi:hypothetical protein
MNDSGFPIEEARAHIERLAAANGITVYEINRMWDSEADIRLRTIYVADPTTPLRYMIALHEMGHIVDKAARLLHDECNNPACEAAAWGWAYKAGNPAIMKFLTPRHWRRIGRAWVTNLGKAARSVGTRP